MIIITDTVLFLKGYFGLREKNYLKQYTRFTLILYVFPCIIALMEFGERMYGDGIYVLS